MSLAGQHVTLHHGKTYKATLSLSWFESFADNDTVAGYLKGHGFTNVTVEGDGEERTAVGTWNKPDTTAVADDHITSVVVV
jgi:hypothetical protein